MLIIAQNRKNSSHSFMQEAAGAAERPASPSQTNPLSLQRYYQPISSTLSRKHLPKPGARGLSLHDLFAAAIGGLLIAPAAWAGADFQAIEPAGPAKNGSPADAQAVDARLAAKPGTESIVSSSENPKLIAETNSFMNNASSQAIVVQWTSPNGNQWVVPLSFDGVNSVAAIEINKPLAMIGAEHPAGELKTETAADTVATSITMKPASRRTAWPIDSNDAEKDQPKL